jgi:hypothetical protein
MPDNSAQVMERVEITLPEPLMDHYRKLAREQKEPLEVILENQLFRCKDYQSQRPLYFADSQRNELERLTGGRVLKDADEAVRAVRNTMSFWVGLPGNDPVQVTLENTLASRLLSRKFGRTVEEHLQTEVKENLERFCGMR